jgi:phosphoserine aminotransferase
MKKIFLTPGPAELYPTVENHLKMALREGICSISHRSTTFKKIYEEAADNLRELLALPRTFSVLFLGSANEIWERSLQNLAEKKSFHFVNGSFSDSYAKFAEALGKNPTSLRVENGAGFSLREMPADIEPDFIAVTANETSTGVFTGAEKLAYLRENCQNALISVDAVSILPCYEANPQHFDSIFFSVQKAFGLPAGLGVWIVNEKCLEKAEKLQKNGHYVGTFHALPELVKKAKEHQTPETPNVLAIYLLAKVCGDMLRYGKARMLREQQYKAALLYHTLDKSEKMSAFVKNPEFRSPTVINATCSEPKKISDFFSEKLNLQLGSGYGNMKETQLRIANFPATSKETVEMLCDAIENLA